MAFLGFCEATCGRTLFLKNDHGYTAAWVGLEETYLKLPSGKLT
jgi:hypothetical protein